MRRGGEWRGLGEQGKRGAEGKWSSAGAAGRVSARAREVPAPLPARLRPRLSGPPAATRHSAPRQLGGNTLPWGLSEPGCLRCQHVPRTPASTPTPSRPHRLPLPPAGPGPWRADEPLHGSAVPSLPALCPGLSGSPGIAGHSHPARTARTGNLGTKRRQPKVRAGDGRQETPPPQV